MEAEIAPEEVFYIVEEMPKFNGGDPAVEFRKFLYENLQYPLEESKNKISGRVIVKFTVTSNGTVDDVKVVLGVSKALDAEAKRVVELSPPWTPGRQEGKPVSVMFTFPINFVID